MKLKCIKLPSPNYRFFHGAHSSIWYGLDVDKPYDLKTRGKYTSELRPFILFIPPYDGFGQDSTESVMKELLYGSTGISRGFEKTFDVKTPPFHSIPRKIIPYKERSKVSGISDEIPRNVNLIFILTRIEDKEQKDSAYRYVKKEFALKGIPSQVITSKLMDKGTKRNDEYRAMLRNLIVQSYRKINGTPCVLSRSLGQGTIFVGFRYLYDENGHVFVTAHAFSSIGEYVYGDLRRFHKYNKYYGFKTVLENLLNELKNVRRLVLHYHGDLKVNDLTELISILERGEFELTIASITKPTNPAWRIFKISRKDYLPERGICVPLFQNAAVLTLTGLEISKGTPQGRFIEIKYPKNIQKTDLIKRCREIYHFSELNFASALGYMGMPVTAEFASKIVETCRWGYPEQIESVEDPNLKMRFFNALAH